MLNVHVGHMPIGALVRSDLARGTFYFSYGENCQPQNAVSLTMPVVSDPYPFQYKHQLHPIFDMNLPEGELSKRLRQQLGKALPQFDDLALLEIIGKSQIGRLRFAPPGASFIEMPTQSIAELIKHDGAEGFFESLLERYAIYSGISGVQPKVLLRDSEFQNKGHISHREATHIVKAWTDEYPQLAANEYFCLRAALHSGLEVPNITLSEHGAFLIVERFDLKDNVYLGFEDFCVLTGRTSEQKYEGSYENVAKRIREFVSSEQVRPALENFFKILTLSCVVKNGDAHLKNFAVLYNDTESVVRLSPVYDIVTTTVYYPKDCLALTLAGTKRWPKTKHLIRFACQHCFLSEGKANELIAQVSEGVAKASAEIDAYIKQNISFQDIGSRMLTEWRGWKPDSA